MKSDIISIAMGELQVAFDNEVVKAVQKVGIDVDKEELLKALELYHNLVRCRECKYWLDGSGLCKHWSKLYGSVLTKADDFCSYGSRSEKPNKSEIPTGSERSSE